MSKYNEWDLGGRLPEEEPETDGIARVHYKCSRTQLTIQVDPIDYEVVSNRIVKIAHCPLCLGVHHLRMWSLGEWRRAVTNHLPNVSGDQ